MLLSFLLTEGKISYFFDAVWISKLFFSSMRFMQHSSLTSSAVQTSPPQAVRWASVAQQKGREGCEAKSSLCMVELLYHGQLSGSIATSSDLSIWWFYAIAIGKESTGKVDELLPMVRYWKLTTLAAGKAKGKENYGCLASASVLWLVLASGDWWCQTAIQIFSIARWSHQAWHAGFPSVHGHVFSLCPLSYTPYV